MEADQKRQSKLIKELKEQYDTQRQENAKMKEQVSEMFYTVQQIPELMKTMQQKEPSSPKIQDLFDNPDLVSQRS